MSKNKVNMCLRKRIMSMALVFAMIFALFPADLFVTDAVADSSVNIGDPGSRLQVNFMSNQHDLASYYSTTLGSYVTIRFIPIVYENGDPSLAWCLDHGKQLGTGTWTYDQPLESTAADPFIAWYFFHMYVLGDWDVRSEQIISGFIQAALWVWLTNPSWTYSDDAFIQAAATERRAALEALGVTPEPTFEDTVAFLKNIIMNYEAGVYGSVKSYVYEVAWSNDYQRLLAPTYSYSSVEESYDVFIKLSKTLSDTSGYYAGASFGVFYDSACSAQAGIVATGSSQWSTSGAISINSASTTLYVKELSTGSADVAIDPTVYSVSVNGNTNNTAATAAAVVGKGSGGVIENKTRTLEKPPEGVITKVDAITGAGVGPACFRIEGESKSGTHIEHDVWTDEGGNIDLQWWDASETGSYIPEGVYYVTETQAPPGYALTSDAPQYLKLWLEWVEDDSYDEGGYYEAFNSGPITFRDYPKQSITLHKVSGGVGLAGATFKVYKDGTLIGTQVTDAAGKITLSEVELGYYLFEETIAPAGFTVPANNTIGVYVNPADTSTTDYYLSMVNYEYPDIVIEKISADTERGLAGAVFEISIDGRQLGTFKTGADGRIIMGYATYGEFLTDGNSTWTVLAREIDAPSGYLIAEPNWQQNVIIKGQKLSTFTFKNQAYPRIAIEKRDSVTNEPLMGAAYEVYIDGAKLGTFATELDGRITITHDFYGSFLNENNSTWAVRVVEVKAPDGYFLAGTITQENQLRRDQELSPFVFTNQPFPNVIVHKTDSKTGEPLAGVTFTLDGVDNSASYVRTSGDDGLATFLSIPEGTYTLSETAVPTGYKLNEKSFTVVVRPGCDQVFDYYYANDRLPNLTLRKLDSITGDVLEGVAFKFEYRSTSGGAYEDIGTYYTDENGRIILLNLNEGWWKATEIEPPNGYQYDKTTGESQEFFLRGNEDHTITFKNTPLSALIIRKIDNDTGLPVQGAAFRVRYLGGTSGTGGTVIFEGTTSINGTIVLTDLKAGTYIVDEYRAAEGYELANPSTQTVFLSGNAQDIVEVEFTNAKKGGLLIQKFDSATGKPLAGAQFKVTDSGGAFIGPNNGIYTTDASGIINLGEYLPIGSSIVVQEIVAPDGYILDTSAQTLKIKENTLHTLTFFNSPKSGLQIVKIDSITKQPVKGAEFTIYKKSGEVIGTYQTDGDGLIILDGLYSGWIKVVETRAPDGYILDDTPKDLEITTNQFIKVVFENTPVPDLQILKLDEETRKPIAGVEFRVAKMNGEIIGTYRTDSQGVIRIPALQSGWYSVSETKCASGYLQDDTTHTVEVKAGQTAVLTITNRKASGIMIHKVDSISGRGIYGVQFLIMDANKNPLTVVESDQSGYVYIPQIPDGRYYVREIRAAEGYEIDDEIKTVYISSGGTSQITWQNSPSIGQIQIIKYAQDDNPVTGLKAGALLQGAVFEISKARNGVVVGYITTDARGIAASDPLPFGRYIIKEVTAPPYYQLSTEKFDVDIEYAGQIIKLSAYNKSVNLGTSISKKGNIEVIAGDSMRYDIYDIANTSNVPLSDFYWYDRIPVDAANVTSMTTGTYSQRLYYRVIFRTNLNDYRVIASNLLTTNNYSFNLSSAALGLMAGEVVTEVRLEFGTVEAGFHSIKNPTITVKTYAGLSGGYQFTNNAEVGGSYRGAWEGSRAKWVTKIIKYNQNQPKLPQTGY